MYNINIYAQNQILSEQLKDRIENQPSPKKRCSAQGETSQGTKTRSCAIFLRETPLTPDFPAGAHHIPLGVVDRQGLNDNNDDESSSSSSDSEINL